MNNERVNSGISSPTPPIPCPTDTVTGCQGAAGVTPASASPDDTCSPFTSSIRSQLPVLGQPDGEGHWGRGEEKRQDPISSPLLLPAGPCRSKSMPLPALWASADRAQLSGRGPRWGQGCLISQGCEHGSPLPHFRGLGLPPQLMQRVEGGQREHAGVCGWETGLRSSCFSAGAAVSPGGRPRPPGRSRSRAESHPPSSGHTRASGGRAGCRQTPCCRRASISCGR